MSNNYKINFLNFEQQMGREACCNFDKKSSQRTEKFIKTFTS